MPFGPLFQPSIALGLLQASLAQNSIATQSKYFTIDFARRVGVPIYTRLANGEPATYDLVGEWIFSAAVFGRHEHIDKAYISEVLLGQSTHHAEPNTNSKPIDNNFLEEILAARSQVEDFLSSCVDYILELKPTVIGFTDTFQQQMASLGLAKQLKAVMPNTTIVFGGANCEGVMGLELLKHFEFVDVVVSGEGDIAFPQLVERLFAGLPYADIAGVYTQAGSGLTVMGVPHGGTSIANMDDLPYPLYDDYFQQWNEAAFAEKDMPRPRLLYESARGCWWGEKHHCTFCGLNGLGMTFRSKTADRALGELVFLTERYPDHAVSVVDNILDMRYLKTFVPKLANLGLNLELFYEVKSNLTKEQLLLMRAAGITSIQPGIESFSTHVLQLMNKGTTGLLNIQLLKWCKEIGIEAHWNIIWGFPGESPEDYSQMAKLMSSISHLRPPSSASKLRLDRFSPNFDAADKFGFSNVRPYPSYSYIYAPLGDAAVANLAYFFTYDYKDERDVATYTKQVLDGVANWQKAFIDDDLFYVDLEDRLLVWDLRHGVQERLVVLDEPIRSIYLWCDGIQHTNRLRKLLVEVFGSIDEADFAAHIDLLLSKRLIWMEESRIIALALPLDRYSPSREVLTRFQNLIEEIGSSDEEQVFISLSDKRSVSEEVKLSSSLNHK
jgi:ribosomal peptide maturation radical SAM protein 1